VETDFLHSLKCALFTISVVYKMILSDGDSLSFCDSITRVMDAGKIPDTSRQKEKKKLVPVAPHNPHILGRSIRTAGKYDTGSAETRKDNRNTTVLCHDNKLHVKRRKQLRTLWYSISESNDMAICRKVSVELAPN